MTYMSGYTTHDPQTRQERLFEPAPFAQLDGQQHLDTDERQETKP